MRSVVGRAEPRLYTRPRRRLTPRTSKGFEVVLFAERVLKVRLMPWQKWLLTHALELNLDGTYRFRYVFVLVSRQNGKTMLLAVLALWRLLVDEARLVLGTSTNLDYARESWEQAVSFAEDCEETHPEFRWPPRRTNGEQTLSTVDGARYKIAAANRRGGRSLSVDLGIADELREHQSFEAWAALSGTTTARPDPQLWALSNMGDDTSIVLNHFRDLLVELDDDGVTELGVRDVEEHALFEWSAPYGCAIDDVSAIRQANPALGHTITMATLAGKQMLPADVYRTEHLCQRVRQLGDLAIDQAAWRGTGDPSASMDDVRRRVRLCLDVADDGSAVAVAAAARSNERVHVEVVAAWPSVKAMRAELPELLATVRPRAVGWFPKGPAAQVAPDIRKLRVRVQEVKTELPAVCASFAELVASRRLVHNDDPMLAGQVAGTVKAKDGTFSRSAGNVHALYAAAGAVWLVRSARVVGKPRVVVAS